MHFPSKYSSQTFYFPNAQSKNSYGLLYINISDSGITVDNNSRQSICFHYMISNRSSNFIITSLISQDYDQLSRSKFKCLQGIHLKVNVESGYTQLINFITLTKRSGYWLMLPNDENLNMQVIQD
ncbi:unnamed protein product [Paramecium octaurelia]|uniref:Uncharacterized protein n=1 Tax=Paramecium octaurelia TaxID=43137 RepID=A0A8S1XE19_PAROT|nr:unnamed protein product [Paramecium octaurelia]